MLRDQALLKVAELIVHTRQATYGDSVTQLAHCTTIKHAVGHQERVHQDDSPINMTECEALDMICTKLSRIVNGRPHEDNWLDIIGYAAIAIESRHVISLQAPSIIITEDEKELEEARTIAKKFAPGGIQRRDAG